MPASPAADELILEGVVTTATEGSHCNIAPMGPRVDREITRLLLRPFQTSQTYQNLKRHGEGVFHVTDDVDLIARAAIGRLDPTPPLVPCGTCWRLADCCRWLAFRVTDLDERDERTSIRCEVVDRGTVREFWGFNRAKHAVLEAAIVATRVGILPADEILAEMKRLSIPVEKTAGEQERRAFGLLRDYVNDKLRP